MRFAATLNEDPVFKSRIWIAAIMRNSVANVLPWQVIGIPAISLIWECYPEADVIEQATSGQRPLSRRGDRAAAIGD